MGDAPTTKTVETDFMKNVVAEGRLYDIYGSAPSIDATRNRSAATEEEAASWAALRATGNGTSE